MDNSPSVAKTKGLPFGILPSPCRLRRRSAAGILTARSSGLTAPHAPVARSRSDGRGTPRESITGPVTPRPGFHRWRDSLRVTGPQMHGCANMRNVVRGYAHICAHARIYANRATCCTCVHMVANSCRDLDGKMCIVGPHGKPCSPSMPSLTRASRSTVSCSARLTLAVVAG